MYILDYLKIISKYFSFIGVGENNGHTSRFLGFSIFISNTTMKEDGWLCFHDNSFYNLTTIPAILTLECIMHGRYVIYYNERKEGQPHYYSDEAIIELCELEVNGNLLNIFGHIHTCIKISIKHFFQFGFISVMKFLICK